MQPVFVESNVIRARNAKLPIPMINDRTKRKFAAMDCDQLIANLQRLQEQYDTFLEPTAAALIPYIKTLIEQK